MPRKKAKKGSQAYLKGEILSNLDEAVAVRIHKTLLPRQRRRGGDGDDDDSASYDKNAAVVMPPSPLLRFVMGQKRSHLIDPF
mmetsp:Transcript_17205/g.27944  ORF Transcript_17205/g.27944 Transcript_17205/m.27944 type:complete len:83 (+) Transcript_17205:677-925(+)